MEPKKNPKAEVGRWSSTFFAAGLAFMLFVAWQAVEWKTYEKDDLVGDVLDVGDDLDEEIPITQQLTPPPPPPPPPPAPEVIEVVENEQEVSRFVGAKSEQQVMDFYNG